MKTRRTVAVLLASAAVATAAPASAQIPPELAELFGQFGIPVDENGEPVPPAPVEPAPPVEPLTPEELFEQLGIPFPGSEPAPSPDPPPVADPLSNEELAALLGIPVELLTPPTTLPVPWTPAPAEVTPAPAPEPPDFDALAEQLGLDAIGITIDENGVVTIPPSRPPAGAPTAVAAPASPPEPLSLDELAEQLGFDALGITFDENSGIVTPPSPPAAVAPPVEPPTIEELAALLGLPVEVLEPSTATLEATSISVPEPTAGALAAFGWLLGLGRRRPSGR